jgi:hypothetical protein
MIHAEREPSGDCFAHKMQSLLRRAPTGARLYLLKASPATKPLLILTNFRTIPYQNPAFSPSCGENCAATGTRVIRP